jgi:SAM-dependent methyltransferase
MQDWSEGYVTEVNYTYGYYGELDPLRAQWALLSAGIEPPAAGPQGPVCCELGFGQGISINIHAAAQGTAWWGTDFNPAQATFARKLARASGAALHLVDDAFAEFARRDDLPQFDFIGLHGIWSWVSDDNRAVIVDFIRRHLRIGGVVYASYNTLPGWAGGMPLRQLMTEHARAMAAPGTGMHQRIDAALGFAQRLLALNPAAARANPQMAERLKRISEQNRNYLAHEYFNRDWKPMHFSEMADWLAPAKLTFAASAYLVDHLRSVNFTAEQQKLLEEIGDPVLAETVRDYCVNQQFRRDLWVRGAHRLTAGEAAAAMRAMRVVLAQPAAQVSLKVATPLGEAQLNADVYTPVVEALADHQPRDVGALERQLAARGLRWPQLREVITVLAGSGTLAFAQPEKTALRQRSACERLNAAVVQMSHTRQDLAYLASAVTGGGVQVPRLEQLFLAGRAQQPKGAPAQWAEYAGAVLAGNGERLMKDGAAIASPEENQAELQARARSFADQRLPLLKALAIA